MHQSQARRKRTKLTKFLVAALCMTTFAASADVFEWTNDTDMTPARENAASWLGGQCPASHKADESSAVRLDVLIPVIEVILK